MYKNRYDWSALEKIAPPEKWLKVYEHYQDLLLKEDLAGWWGEQFAIADAERQDLKRKLINLEVRYQKLMELTRQL